MKVLFHLWCETIKTEKIEKMEIETEIRQDRGNGAEKLPISRLTSSVLLEINCTQIIISDVINFKTFIRTKLFVLLLQWNISE